MDVVHVLVHADEVKDGGDIDAAIILVADVENCIEESHAISGSAHAGPRVHCEQLCLHLRCSMLHHQVVHPLGILAPPLLFILGVVVFPLSLRRFEKVG